MVKHEDSDSPFDGNIVFYFDKINVYVVALQEIKHKKPVEACIIFGSFSVMKHIGRAGGAVAVVGQD